MPLNQNRNLSTLFNGLGARRAPRVLYHYTSSAAVVGVLRDRSFWATNIRFLNDAKEFQFALDLLEELLNDKIGSASTKYLRALYTVLRDSLTESHAADVYVASFSEDGDQLGQWRAYCPPGAGYAVGLTPAALRRAKGASDRLLLLRCLYDGEEQTILLERLVGLAESYAESEHIASSSNQDRVYREAFKLFATWLPAVAAVIKHPSFAEEREWRLVAPAAFFDKSLPAVRTGRSMLVPYHEFVLSDVSSPMPVHSVVVGPTPHPTLATDGIRALCASQGIRGAEVSLSEIPYRTW